MSATESIPAQLPLEDDYTDVLNKARRGLKLTLEELADRTGLSVESIQQIKPGQVDPVQIEKLAFALHLDAPALIALARRQWQPKPIQSPTGLACFTTWYGDMTVNAYLLWNPETGEAASFDTGAHCRDMLAFIAEKQLRLQKIFITHTHMDHLADLEALQAAHPDAISYGSAIENPLGLKPLSHEDGLIVGRLKIRVLGTSGHTPGGLSYFIQGLPKPIVVVGDALFAGSMGGAPYAYQEARSNNLHKILSLPEGTLICPGHGPMTTVGEERAHNPFFPELKSI